MGKLRGGGAFTAVPTPGRVGFSTVGALGRSGGAAIQDRPEVTSLGAGGVGASVLSLRIVKRAKGAGGRFLFAPVLDMAELPALLAMGLGRGGVGSFHCAGAPVQVYGWKHILDGFRIDVDNHLIGSFLESGSTIQIEKTGAEDCDILGVEDRFRQLGHKVSIVPWHEGNRQRVDGPGQLH